ncbi:GntR family transcriptional regulator [soil metagenome]
MDTRGPTAAIGLSKTSRRPLYLQLYEILRAQVQTGELGPGDMIPPESELTRRFGVSRITVRAALDHLVQDGIIDRHRGRGSFVRASAPEARACLTSFTEQVSRSGRIPTTDVVRVVIAHAASFAPVALPFDSDVRVALVERVRRVDGVRVALVRSYLPEALVPGIDASCFASSGAQQSLLHVLEHRFGVVLDKGEETLWPTTVTRADAAVLHVPEGSPVAVRFCRVDDRSGAVCIYEEAAWCAPQTQLVQRVCAPPLP